MTAIVEARGDSPPQFKWAFDAVEGLEGGTNAHYRNVSIVQESPEETLPHMQALDAAERELGRAARQDSPLGDDAAVGKGQFGGALSEERHSRNERGNGGK